MLTAAERGTVALPRRLLHLVLQQQQLLLLLLLDHQSAWPEAAPAANPESPR